MSSLGSDLTICLLTIFFKYYLRLVKYFRFKSNLHLKTSKNTKIIVIVFLKIKIKKTETNQEASTNKIPRLVGQSIKLHRTKSGVQSNSLL